ncbi:LOG family protein [Companilactobacillus baiquanensis]|uniref:Cytokinin riboside 5'-monophosphate phosphoribohydrolase n=1 Tax=Companilactobacillus baiquanensis TaxID=2486005 RepID=A0ABW1UU71_9LACO|nr:TIGR00730 family Rossman fold protein [Companilactobacillus baiquanensis]
MKNIAVYCGAASGNKAVFKESAINLGHWIVKNDYGLTYGGGHFGLMGVIADTVLADHGYVHGIITETLNERNLSHQKLSKLDIVDSMDTRKILMLSDSIASIALPGGPGTLEEISEAYSWTRIGDNNNPCIFYNVNHYYDPLEKFFDSMTENGFLDEYARKSLLFSDSLAEIGKFILNYKTPPIRHF